ncbi:MAG: DUF4383 domain-containing protein [Sphingomonadaceae bacterium]|nr:DUF4383 domain-containing protein [Sphingomonadaceae bacterium]
MSTRTFALIFGIIFLLAGIAGFIPQLLQPAQGGAIAPGPHHMLLLGMFPVNPVHNIVHLAFGLWGLVASRAGAQALLYARSVAIIYAILVVAGFIPSLDTLFGLVPLYGNDVWLHLALAIVAAYFGWVNRSPSTAV